MVKSKEKSVDFQWFWTASQFGQEKVQEGYIIPGLSLRVIPQNCGIVSRSLSGTMVLDTSSFVGHSNWQCQLKLNFITINSIGSLRVFSIERKRKWKSIEKPFRYNGSRYVLLRRTLELTLLACFQFSNYWLCYVTSSVFNGAERVAFICFQALSLSSQFKYSLPCNPLFFDLSLS